MVSFLFFILACVTEGGINRREIGYMEYEAIFLSTYVLNLCHVRYTFDI